MKLLTALRDAILEWAEVLYQYRKAQGLKGYY